MVGFLTAGFTQSCYDWLGFGWWRYCSGGSSSGFRARHESSRRRKVEVVGVRLEIKCSVQMWVRCGRVWRQLTAV